MARSYIARGLGKYVFVLIVSVGFYVPAHAEDAATCSRWLNRVAATDHAQPREVATSSVNTSTRTDPWNISSLPESVKMEAIQCLLNAEDDLRPAAFSGATRTNTSQLFAPARVNLAALYLISYIYTGHYDHAAAIALRGPNAEAKDDNGLYETKPEAIHIAYKAYREWYAKVRKIGFAKAHQENLQPLAGTGLYWY